MANAKEARKWNDKLEKLGLGMSRGSAGDAEQQYAILEYLDNSERTDPFLEDNLDRTVSKILTAEPVLTGFQTSDNLKELRKSLDGADNFVAGGHAVRGGGGTKHSARVARIPEWVNDPAKIKALILSVFPNIENSAVQRERAGRWARVIQLYYRMGLTHGRICQIVGMTPSTLKCIILRIEKNANNLNQVNEVAEDETLHAPYGATDSAPKDDRDGDEESPRS